MLTKKYKVGVPPLKVIYDFKNDILMLTKKQQTRKMSRLKDNSEVKDKAYLSYLHTQNLSCFSCGKCNNIELHHIKEHSSDKKNDQQVIPLCGEECHRNGTELSAHGTPKKFIEVYPIEKQLEYASILYRDYLESKGY